MHPIHQCRYALLALLPAAALLAGLAACSPTTDLDAALPTATTTSSGAFLVDTLTVRLATVLQDSVDTSTPTGLLLGRYHDPRLGSVSASAYFRLGLGAIFAPGASETFDSLTLVLGTDGFAYGDTTQLQTLEVHRLRTQLADSKTYYAFDALPYDAAALNWGGAAWAFRFAPSRRTLRLRLADALGRELLAAAQASPIGSDTELAALLAGLVLTPGATDEAALLRMLLGTSSLNLYTHSPADPTTALTQSFPLSYSTKHFYHVAAERSGTLLAPLTAPLQALDVRQTAEEAYLSGALGLETRLEIPYLTALRDFGPHLVVSSAQAALETVPNSGTPALAPPPTLATYLGTRNNRRGAAVSSVAYQTGQSGRSGLDTGGYSLDLTAYCQAVLNGTLDNTGLLLASAAPQVPARVVLGGPRHREAPLSFKLYFVR